MTDEYNWIRANQALVARTPCVRDNLSCSVHGSWWPSAERRCDWARHLRQQLHVDGEGRTFCGLLDLDTLTEALIASNLIPRYAEYARQLGLTKEDDRVLAANWAAAIIEALPGEGTGG